MRIGYPCINNSVGCTSGRTFRLASYSPERFRQTLKENLDCLGKTLEFNRAHGLLFFRLVSQLCDAGDPRQGTQRASSRRTGCRALIVRAGLPGTKHPTGDFQGLG